MHCDTESQELQLLMATEHDEHCWLVPEPDTVVPDGHGVHAEPEFAAPSTHCVQVSALTHKSQSSMHGSHVWLPATPETKVPAPHGVHSVPVLA